MKCHSVQRKFSAYQDKELKPREQEEVSKHMLSCPSCREQFAELEQVWRTLEGLEEIHPDPWFYRQVVGKIKETREQGLLPSIQRVFQMSRAPAIASILLVIGVLTGIYLGNILVQNDFLPFQPIPTGYRQDAILDSLKVFDSAPPGTLAHGYLQLVSYKEHEHE